MSAPAADPGATRSTIVELSGIRKVYNPGTPIETEVLHGIDLRLSRGEFAALIGPSGSGKSTLLNIIGLLESASAGSYHLAGQPVDRLDDAALTRARLTTLGFIFQFHHLLPAFSALENVTLPALMRNGRVGEEDVERARALLRAVGLEAAARKRPGELSGGMQQRVALVRGFALGAPVLLLDEPFAALDEITRTGMRGLVSRLVERRSID